MVKHGVTRHEHADHGVRQFAAALLLGTAIGADAGSAAHAQATSGGGQTQATPAIEEIIVTGIRKGLLDSIDSKRRADTQIDVISAEDIGKLPDADIGDSLQRVTGVQIQRGEDGVAREVAIRGLPANFVRVLYNGRAITTSINNSRNFSFEIFPSSFAQRAEVHKTSSSDLLEGGLAGTVNIKSQRAFDLNRHAFVLSARGDHFGNSGDFAPDVSVLFSRLFAGSTLGFTAGFNYLDQNIASQITTSADPNTAFVENAARRADFNGDGDFLDTVRGPRQVRFEYHDATRERIAGFANLEWRPSDNLSLFGEAFYSNYDTAENRARFVFAPASTNNPVGPDMVTTQLNGSEYWQAYHARNIGVQVDTSPITRESDVLVTTLDVRYTSGPWSFSPGASMSKSKTDWNSILAIANLPTAGLDATLDGTQGGPWAVNFTNPDAVRALLVNPAGLSNFSINAAQLGTEQENSSASLNFDVAREFESGASGSFNINSIQTGVHYGEDESLAIQPTGTLSQAQLTSLGISIPLELIEVDAGRWFDGASQSTGAPPPWLTPSVDGLLKNLSIAQLVDAMTSRGTYRPGFRDDVREDTLRAYVKINFSGLNDAISGNIGLRYVRTDQKASGRGSDLTAGLIDNGGVLSLPVVDLISRERRYSQWLPSLNVAFKLSDDQVLRLGASRTTSRPEKEDLSVATTFNAATLTINSADPDLKPFVADGLDLSYEWYFAPESLLSIGSFYKDLQSLVQTVELSGLSFTVTNATTGATRQEAFTLVGKSNAEGVILKGAEISYQQPFFFLPAPLDNFGTQLNYTFIDNSNPEILAAASKHNFNATLYYSSNKFDARVAYTYRGKYLQFPAEGTLPSRSFEKFDYLTASVNYTISQNFKINAAVSNILDRGTLVTNGNGTTRAFNDFGRRLTVGVTARF